jgi:acetyl-CoA acyltransferase
VVVGGVRTPFVKAFAEFLKMDTIALGGRRHPALLERTELSRAEIDAIVWGGVILPGMAPNVGREIALDLRCRPRSRR